MRGLLAFVYEPRLSFYIQFYGLACEKPLRGEKNDRLSGTIPLFTDCLRISSVKALQFLLQARVLTYNGPAREAEGGIKEGAGPWGRNCFTRG